jgi:DNA-binding transcriptional MocR family regulator
LYADDQDVILDILEECVQAGNPDLVYQFASTSKVSFAGAGISAMSSSAANIAEAKKQLSFATIGFDKLNQLRHVRYFASGEGIAAHMEKHAAILAPKFEAVLETLTSSLAGRSLGTWIKPKGGYFITFEANLGCATDILARAKEAGLVMTPAGAPYPYGNDPKDSVIRIAPSFPTSDELKTATELFVLCVKLVGIEKELSSR